MRWTRGGAMLTLRVEGRVLRLALACPIPQVRGRPQTVSIRLDRAPVRRVTLETPAWKTVEIPVDKRVGSTVVLQLRVGYTFVPAALGLNDDARHLGILMKPLAWAEP